MFIKLHSAYKDVERKNAAFLVNPAYITMIEVYEKSSDIIDDTEGTFVTIVDGGALLVRETPAEIVKLIESLY